MLDEGRALVRAAEIIPSHGLGARGGLVRTAWVCSLAAWPCDKPRWRVSSAVVTGRRHTKETVSPESPRSPRTGSRARGSVDRTQEILPPWSPSSQPSLQPSRPSAVPSQKHRHLRIGIRFTLRRLRRQPKAVCTSGTCSRKKDGQRSWRVTAGQRRSRDLLKTRVPRRVRGQIWQECHKLHDFIQSDLQRPGAFANVNVRTSMAG